MKDMVTSRRRCTIFVAPLSGRTRRTPCRRTLIAVYFRFRSRRPIRLPRPSRRCRRAAAEPETAWRPTARTVRTEADFRDRRHSIGIRRDAGSTRLISTSGWRRRLQRLQRWLCDVSSGWLRWPVCAATCDRIFDWSPSASSKRWNINIPFVARGTSRVWSLSARTFHDSTMNGEYYRIVRFSHV